MDPSAYDYVIGQTKIPEIIVPGKPLGRHIRHDSRSLEYLAPEREDLPTTAYHDRTVPVFDQGSLGSCTGNAAVGAVATKPVVDGLVGFTHPVLDESLAVNVYSQATALDSYPGQYPPTDTGSDGLAVAQVLKSLGYLSGYTHATTRQATLTALSTVPVWIGINWYEGFDSPDGYGHVSISGQVRGGHEICLVGYNAGPTTVTLGSVQVPPNCFLAVNSWGPSFGVSGYFTFSFADYDRLLNEQGDCTVPVPLSEPAPTPTPPSPTPVPDLGADEDFAGVLHTWLAKNRFFYHSVQQAARAWLAARNL